MATQTKLRAGASGFHQVRSMKVVGGFLDGLTLELAAGLTCIIGGRGAGKTTVLEFIRYALNLEPGRELDPAGHRRFQGLVERNLAGGRIELEVETKDKLVYRVVRAQGEEPVIRTAEGRPTDLALSSGFFRADIYSQNEVESIADRSLSQLDLIDSFEPEALKGLETQLRQVSMALDSNATAIRPLEEGLEGLADEISLLPGIKEKLRGFAAGSGEDARAINKAHQDKALRDRESRAVAALSEDLEAYAEEVARLHGRLEQLAARHLGRELQQGPNGALIRGLAQGLRDRGKEVDECLNEAAASAKRGGTEAEDGATKLRAAHQEQELAFQTLLEKHREAQGQAAERTQLERRQNELLAKQREREELQAQLKRLRAERVQLLRKLSDLRDERCQVRRKIAERISGSLKPYLRVSVDECGNAERYKEVLEEAFRQVRQRPSYLVPKLVDALLPADLVKVAAERNAQAFVDRAGLTAEQAERALAALSDPDLLYQIEAVELPDQPRIELLDGDQYKASQVLSTGQKCTAILPILLLESEAPLLVDQPEDNLDNRFIAETILESIRKVKTQRQLILITHNPNIPVLGEAEQVVVMESDGVRGRARTGTVDQCKADIVTLLEGGEKAFRLRKERYNY